MLLPPQQHVSCHGSNMCRVIPLHGSNMCRVIPLPSLGCLGTVSRCVRCSLCALVEVCLCALVAVCLYVLLSPRHSIKADTSATLA